MPKAIASNNTMAYIITAKYADGLPLYRLSPIMQRYGIDFSRQTISESVIAVAQKAAPLLDYFRQVLNSGHVMHMDETTVPVLNEPGKAGRADSALSLIAKLYAVEKRHKDSDSKLRQLARATESHPVLDDLKQWLDKAQREVPPTRAPRACRIIRPKSHSCDFLQKIDLKWPIRGSIFVY